jgi:hypothetical protein
MSKRLLPFLLALLFLSYSEAKEVPVLVPAQPDQQRPDFAPFENGENASYQASWNGIPVATADVRTSPLWVDGKKVLQVDVEARTQKVLDLVWKMRDSLQSVFEAETFRPKQFAFRQRENSRSTNTNALYDQTEKKWTFSRVRGKETSRFEIDSSNTLDPITAAYLIRSLDFKVGDQLRAYVFGAKDRYLVTLDVVGRETVTTQAGTFDAYRITPRLQNLTKSGRADKTRQATLWVSADSRRLPVKLQSQSFVGSVYMEMVKNEIIQNASLQKHTAEPASKN